MMILSSFLRKIPTNPVIFSYVPAKNFAKLPSKDLNLKDSPIEMPFEGYYEDVLRSCKVNKTGRMKLQPYHLSTLLLKVKSKNDYHLLLDAYYNFVGNSALFPQKLVDNLVRKGIELGEYKLLFPLIKNHNYFFYYPAPSLLTEYIATVEKNKYYELIHQFLKVFERQRLLKPEVKTYEIMISETYRAKQYKHSLKLLSLIALRNFQLPMDAFRKLAYSMVFFYDKVSKKKLNRRKYDRLNSVLDKNLDKPSEVLLALSWLNILLESVHGTLYHAFLFLEDYIKKLNSETEKTQNPYILDKNQLFTDYLSCLDKRLNLDKDPRYFLRFDQFFADFEANYTANKAHPEIWTYIQEKREDYKSKAQEIKAALPQIIQKEKEKFLEKMLKNHAKYEEIERKRLLKAQENRDKHEQERLRAKIAKLDKKAKTYQELSDHPADYTWVDVKKSKKTTKTIIDPETGEEKTVVISKKQKKSIEEFEDLKD